MLAIASCLGFAVACVPVSERTMTCPGDYDGWTVDEILDELDSNGDGSFDEDDLASGESVQLFRFTEADGQERLVVSRDEDSGMNIHRYTSGEGYDWGQRSLFGVWHHFTECSAFGWSTPWFFGEDAEDPELETGRGELYHLAFDIAEIEHGNISLESEVDGWMQVVADDELFSGHMQGSAATDIISYFDQGLTGERAELIAQAFRDLPYSY